MLVLNSMGFMLWLCCQWYTFLSAYCVLGRVPCSFPVLTTYHCPPTHQVWVLGLGGLSEEETFGQSPEVVGEECQGQANSKEKPRGRIRLCEELWGWCKWRAWQGLGASKASSAPVLGPGCVLCHESLYFWPKEPMEDLTSPGCGSGAGFSFFILSDWYLKPTQKFHGANFSLWVTIPTWPFAGACPCLPPAWPGILLAVLSQAGHFPSLGFFFHQPSWWWREGWRRKLEIKGWNVPTWSPPDLLCYGLQTNAHSGGKLQQDTRHSQASGGQAWSERSANGQAMHTPTCRGVWSRGCTLGWVWTQMVVSMLN